MKIFDAIQADMNRDACRRDIEGRTIFFPYEAVQYVIAASRCGDYHDTQLRLPVYGYGRSLEYVVYTCRQILEFDDWQPAMPTPTVSTNTAWRTRRSGVKIKPPKEQKQETWRDRPQML